MPRGGRRAPHSAASKRGACKPGEKDEISQCKACDRYLPGRRLYQPVNRPGDDWWCQPCYDRLLDRWVAIQERAEARDLRFRSVYGISLADYGDLFLSQSGTCGICRRANDLPAAGLLVVDHAHATGKVRGLLCSNCNTGIGLLGDSVPNLAAAIIYLAR